jgi:RNA ligase (TIGR02306 family)
VVIATVGKITSIDNIPDADRIQQATVICGKNGKWAGCIQKDTMRVGDFVEVYLQDALVPQIERFSFMEKHHWRVRVMRLRGALSECLIMPLIVEGNIGDDIASLIGAEKYEKPLPANMGGDILGHFPSFIPKTDEMNFQAAPHLVEAMMGHPWYTTVKVDGASATVYKWQGHLGCCSRNYELKPSENNAIWQIAERYDLSSALPDGTAIQFEVAGPKVQSNPLGLKDITPFLFNVWDIDSREYIPIFHNVVNGGVVFGVSTVPLDDCGGCFDFTDNDLRCMAEGTYTNGRQREGVVVRPQGEMNAGGERVSFKVINLLYKD